MAAPDKMHAAPLEVNIGGKPYKMRRITVGDLAALTADIRSQRIKAAMADLATLPNEKYTRTLAAVICTEPTDAEMFEYMNHPNGQRLILWRCLSHHQPALTRDACDAMIDANGGLALLLELCTMITMESQLTTLLAEGEQSPDPPDKPVSSGEETLPYFKPSTESDMQTAEVSNGRNTQTSSSKPETC